MSGFERAPPRSAEVLVLDDVRRARGLPAPALERLLPPPGKRRGDAVCHPVWGRGAVVGDGVRRLESGQRAIMLAVQFCDMTRVLPAHEVAPASGRGDDAAAPPPADVEA